MNSVATTIQRQLMVNSSGTFLGPFKLRGDNSTAIQYTGKHVNLKTDYSYFYVR